MSKIKGVPDALYYAALTAAAIHKLKPSLVCAVIEQESGWDPWAIRYEPRYEAKYIAAKNPGIEQEDVNAGRPDPASETPRKNVSPTEEITRSMSWGLMQLMGESARELGFTGHFLTALSSVETGLDWGCSWLVRQIAGQGGDVRKGLAKWNGPKNPAYPDEVLARMARYE